MQKIKISFDNQIFNIQRFGGISRYIIALFKEFDKKSNIEWNLLGVFSRNVYLSKNYKGLGKIQLDSWDSGVETSFINKLNKLSYYLPFIQPKFVPDLYHLTYYDAFYFNKLANNIPRVVTVHDMIDEIFEGNPATIYSKKHVIIHADLILANSNSTANDIRKFYNIPQNKIVVTYLASSLQPVKAKGSSTFNLPAKYLLFVGLRRWYKNFDGFLEAIYPLLNNDKDLNIVCAGGPEFTKEELEVQIKFNVQQQVIHKPIYEDDELAGYYQNALFFVFPSMYEGFGIPILEAMNCNCPVVLSDSSSLKEVAGIAGYYFDPRSQASIRKSCLDVLNSDVLRTELIARGKSRRMDFSWEKTASDTIKAYQYLLNR